MGGKRKVRVWAEGINTKKKKKNGDRRRDARTDFP